MTTGNLALLSIDRAISRYRKAWEFSEALDAVEFTTQKNGKGRNCKKGYPCGRSCISTTKNCRNPLSGQAGNYQAWLAAATKPNTPKSPSKAKAATANPAALAPTAAKSKGATPGNKLKDAIAAKDFAAVHENADALYAAAKAKNGNSIYNNIRGAAMGSDHTEDLLLKQLFSDIGYDGQPQKVSKAQMSNLVKDKNNQVMFRRMGSTDARFDAHFDKFKNGDYFVGTGIYGHGTYVASAQGGRSAAAKNNMKDAYDSTGGYGASSMRMTIPRDPGTVVDMIFLSSQMYAFEGGLKRWERTELQRINADVSSGKATQDDVDTFKRRARRTEAVVWGDRSDSGVSGRFAALSGYNAVTLSLAHDENYTLLLNRSAVTVQDTKHP